MTESKIEASHTINIRGEAVPQLGLGTWQLTGDDCVEAVLDALSLGYRHIDTAQMYENEDRVGEAIERSGILREEVFLVTKIGPEHCAERDVLRSVSESLEKLRTDHVDLLLQHWPSDDVPLEETLGAMQRLRDEGRTRYVGVSNFTPSLLEQARRAADIFALQVEYHPLLRQAELLEATRNAGMLFTAYCPLARGRVLEEPALREIGAAHGKSAAQVALRWLLQQGVAAIPKAAGREHRRADLDVFDFRLDEGEMRRIHALARGERLIDPDWAPDWGR